MCITCMYNHDQLIMYAPHSPLRIYPSLYSKCKVSSLAALVADSSGTPTHRLAFLNLHLDASPLA